jgi:hypothetical protein
MTVVSDEFQIAYCREARRLRCAHAGEPGRMLRAIGALSARYDALRGPKSENGAVPVTVVRTRDSGQSQFEQFVAAELAGDVLNYSRRLELLAEAERLGIGRFEANLVIAEAQHRAGPVAETIPATSRVPVGLIGLALGLELLAAVVVYHLLV